MTARTHVFFAAFVAAACPAAAPDARADAIDGMWCKGSRSMQIDGPAIVTPGGTSTTGDYDRHGFRYVAPPGEDGAGKTVNMVLRGEYDLDVTVGDGSAERWRRCKLTSRSRSGAPERPARISETGTYIEIATARRYRFGREVR